MELSTPVIISHMSYGALSEEAKVALSKGSAMAGTAIGSGDGGVLAEEMENAGKYILEYTPDLFSVTDENIKRADAIEIKLSQSARAGLGAYLPAVKVSSDIAAMRGCIEGEDFVGKAAFDGITSKEELKSLVSELRERSIGRPIGIKLAAGRIERDLGTVAYAEPDFITIDGAEGSCGTANSVVRDSSGVPAIYALYRAKKFLADRGLNGKIALIITGGLRSSADFAKVIAMGADAVAVGTAALMSLACQQYRMCESGQCPMGLTTQDPVLRSRLQKEAGAQRVANYLNVSLEEIKSFARITGNDDVHNLSVSDLATVSSDIAENTDIAHV
jgi:glutamate synthase domain-containing protein 2